MISPYAQILIYLDTLGLLFFPLFADLYRDAIVDPNVFQYIRIYYAFGTQFGIVHADMMYNSDFSH